MPADRIRRFHCPSQTLDRLPAAVGYRSGGPSSRPIPDVIDLTAVDDTGDYERPNLGTDQPTKVKRFYTRRVHDFVHATLARKAPLERPALIRRKIADFPIQSLARRHAWKGQPLSSQDGKVYYRSMVLDGVSFSLGDAVAVPVKDGGVRLSLIRWLFEDSADRSKHGKQAHVHWFIDSPLGARNEVFLAERWCDSVPLAKLSRRVTISRHNGLDTPSGLFYRFVYDEERLTFRDPVADGDACDACQASRGPTPTTAGSSEDLNEFQRGNLLPAMDFYAGGGGTMTGARGLFLGKWALDIDPACCDTLAYNHPNATVYCSSLGSLRQQAMRLDRGLPARPLCDLRDGASVLPRLPKRGDVVMLAACPPCQGHTGLNSSKKPDDRRNEELFGTLSEVDRLRPDFFLLENVAGFKAERNDGVFNNDAEVRSFAEITLMGLLRIGYQCRLAILDSRAYGSPQNRIRVFILAARSGVPLPSFPAPTHHNPQHRAISLRKGWLGPNFDEVDERVLRPAVTVRDAVSDLPGFEYKGPNQAVPSSSSRLVPKFEARLGPRGKVGFVSAVPYVSPPQNAYQQAKRRGSLSVTHQYTPGATGAQLGTIMSDPAMLGDKSATTEGSNRRANPERGFPTLLTSSRPGGKATGVIHYEQNRTFSVRERARAQGFPDTYTFLGDTTDMDRMAGNAVNVDIAAAIYKSILLEGVIPWWKVAGRPRSNVFERWRADHPV